MMLADQAAPWTQQPLPEVVRVAYPLPVEQPTKFDLAINLKTAKALGLTIRRRSCSGRIK